MAHLRPPFTLWPLLRSLAGGREHNGLWSHVKSRRSGDERRGEVTKGPHGRLGPYGSRWIGAGKDFKLYPGGGREWDWNETGTRHSPGIQPADVEELLAHGATVVVLSLGMNRRLQVDPHTLDYLSGRSVTVHAAETREAVRIYNDLAQDAPVAGLFHSTC
ncbi:MAG TPA: MTH938/NDUFAF3 family protein [Streptosporangiaceae bacterium]